MEPRTHQGEQPLQPLAGIRVLDVTHVMAGSWCGLLLAQMGADVVKVERRDGADDLRRLQGQGLGFDPFAAVNHGKRSLALDLARPEGVAVLRRLAVTADVFVENFRPGALARRGLGAVELRTANPRLIYASISGFGQTGPNRDRAGFDLVAQGMSGLLMLTGPEGGGPTAVGVPIADLNAGTFAALGVLAALHHRHATGEGQVVDVALADAALAYTVWETALYLGTGLVAPRAGSGHRLAAPYEVFRAADGHFTLAIGTAATWERLCGALGRPDLFADERFATNVSRLFHRGALHESLEAHFGTDTAAGWVTRLAAAGLPCGPVHDLAAALADPQVAAREMLVEHRRADGSVERHLGAPAKLSASPLRAPGPAPRLGEHGAAVLAEYGFTAAEIAALRAAEVLGGGDA